MHTLRRAVLSAGGTQEAVDPQLVPRRTAIIVRTDPDLCHVSLHYRTPRANVLRNAFWTLGALGKGAASDGSVKQMKLARPMAR